MVHIKLKEGFPGIRGLILFRSETGKLPAFEKIKARVEGTKISEAAINKTSR